jgi:putative transposase
MSREVQVSAGGVYDLGYHVVWCPKYRRPVLAGPVKDRGEELIRARAAWHGWRIIALEVMPDHVQAGRSSPASSPGKRKKLPGA